MSFKKLSIFQALLLVLTGVGNVSAQNNPAQQQSPANSGTTSGPPWHASVASLQASIVTGQGFANKAPEGFTNVYSVATGGFGTFVVAVPKGWMQWTAGTPPVAIIEAFRKVDPAWAKAHEPFFSGRDPRQRALLLSGNPNEPIVIKVSFIGRADAKTLEAWRADYRTIFNKDYWDSVSKAEWISHGSEKAVKAISHSPDKAYLEVGYHISETKNNTLWSLTCAGKTQIMQNNVALCDNIASTFAGGPYID
jgi:hypothetical protein